LKPRGYLMIETMLSGAILALMLGAAMSVVASERQAISHATLRAKASVLLDERLHQLMADSDVTKQFTCDTCTKPCSVAIGSATINTDTNINQSDYPGFEREWYCREIGQAVSDALGSVYELGVRVKYPTDSDGNKKTIERLAIRRDRVLDGN
jgi:hypothetical protein